MRVIPELNFFFSPQQSRDTLGDLREQTVKLDELPDVGAGVDRLSSTGKSPDYFSI